MDGSLGCLLQRWWKTHGCNATTTAGNDWLIRKHQQVLLPSAGKVVHIIARKSAEILVIRGSFLPPAGAHVLHKFNGTEMRYKRKSYLSIHAAVMNCVARCSESEVPTVTMVDFLDKLSELGWGEKDIVAVQRAVIPMLGEFKTGETVRSGTDKMTAS